MRGCWPRSRRLVVRAGGGGPGGVPTAWYGLADLAGARAGQRLLVHAATGGVGMAAVADRPAPGPGGVRDREPRQAWACWPGWAWTRRTSPPRGTRGSRAAFLAATGGAGVDIVLNALAGELTDASPAAAGARRGVRGDGQDRPARPRRGRRRTTPGSPTGRSTWPMPARTGWGRSWRGDRAAGGRGAGAAAGAVLGCAAGAGGVPVHEPGPAHRQDRADHPARPGRAPRRRVRCW